MEQPSTNKEFFESIVSVNVPDQGYPIDIVQLDLFRIEDTKVELFGFHPFRMVVNFKVIDTTNGNEVDKFDPPMEIRIRYTASDYARASVARRNLCLGFWNGSKWIQLTEEKHNFHLEYPTLPEDGGWGVALIKHYGDPGYAWGT